MSTGYKTLNGSVAVKAMPVFERLENLHDRLGARKALGLVSTSAVWDATPAAFVAHAPDRKQSRRIACEMILDSRPEVILGGGAAAFLESAPCPGLDQDIDLIAKAREEGYQTLYRRGDLTAATASPKTLGLFAPESMAWQVERAQNSDQPTLTEMSAYALRVLERDPRGFFLMIEGGRIDHAGHETNLENLLGEMREFDETVNLALKWAKERGDTLVIVTADHETGGMEIPPGEYVSGEAVPVNWTTRDQPGHASHSSQLVPIWGYGPGAETIRPIMDNTEISCLIDRALSDGPAPATTWRGKTR